MSDDAHQDRFVRPLTLLCIVLGLAFVSLFAYVSLTRARSFSPDSMNYVDVARNIAAGHGITQSTLGYHDIRFLGRQDWPVPLTAQPPLYPLLIASLTKLGLDATDAALVLPALAFAATLALAGLLLCRVWGRSAAWLGVALLALHFPLNFTGRIAWSDAPGIVLVLLALLPSRGVSLRSRAVFAGIACGLAFVTRYAFAPLVPAVALGIFLASRGETPRRRILHLAAFAIPIAICALPILLRNASLYGHFFPQHFSSAMPLDVAIYQTFASLFGSWLGRFGADIEGIALLVIVAACTVLAKRRGGRIGEHALPSGSVPLVVWLGLYVAFILHQCLTIHLDELGPRLLLPASVPLIIWLAGFAARATRLPVVASLALCCAAFGLRAMEELGHVGSMKPAPTIEERIAASPRLAWIAANVAPNDIVVGDDTVDVPFHFGPRPTVNFSPYPATDYPDYAKLLAWADQHRSGTNRIFLVLRRSGESEEQTKAKFGAFIGDVLAARLKNYPRLNYIAAPERAVVLEISVARP